VRQAGAVLTNLGTRNENASANPIKLRRAPNGRLYAVCYAQPVCRSDGNLRYFETEHEAWTFLAEGRVEDSLEVLSA
jgi:hypothetical protein